MSVIPPVYGLPPCQSQGPAAPRGTENKRPPLPPTVCADRVRRPTASITLCGLGVD
jgi:hypothetical protein